MNLHYSCLLPLVFTAKDSELEWPFIWRRILISGLYTLTLDRKILKSQGLNSDFWSRQVLFLETRLVPFLSLKKTPAVDQHYNDRSWVKTYLTECTQDVTSLQAQLQTTRSYNTTKAFIWVQEAGYQCFHQMSQARAEVGSSQQPAFKMLKKTWQVSKILKIPQGIVFQQSETAVSSACEKSD